MKTTIKSIIINRPLKEVYSIISDFKNWPRLASNFSGTEIIMADTTRHVTIMRSRHGIFNPTIVTYREFINNERIEFNHIVPSFPISKHYGSWTFKAIDDKTTEITLRHYYQCSFSIIGTFLEHCLLERFFIGPHVEKMLKQMKLAIERWND